MRPKVQSQKSLYFVCHSGLDPESSVSRLDSRFRGNDGNGNNVTCWAHYTRGFSFIELMVVLVILSLSISLITPSLSRFLRTVELKGAAKKVSGILRHCRSEAVNKGLVYQVLFDSDLRRISVQSKESIDQKKEEEVKKEREILKKVYPLPDGIQIKKVDIASVQNGTDLPTIEFYPNGGSNGGSIFLDGQDRNGFKIEVHFLTGMVKIIGVEGLKP